MAEMTQKKRKFSEHSISSTGRKEQNLDIPKLESSQAPEANEPIATCGAVVQDASGTSATAAQGLKNRGKRMIRVSSEQSGVPGVSWTWRNKLGSWQVFWFEEKNMKKKYFHVRDFMKTSKIFCEAKDDALRAAIEFRKDLERRGIAKAQHAENPQSGVKGINWNIQQKAWRVYLNINGKQLSGGYFKPKDSTPEEVERARLDAVESRRKLEEIYFTIKQIAAIRVATDCSGMEAPIQVFRNMKVPFQHVMSCDVLKAARMTIEANFNDGVMYKDITTRNHEEAPDCDVYVAGFPCQPFSTAGLQQGFEDARKRGTIFFHCRDFIKTKLPKVFILENVSGLAKKNMALYFESILKELRDMNKYNVDWSLLNTKESGIPQSRQRVYIVGIRKDVDKGSFKWPEKIPMAALENFLEPLSDKDDLRQTT